MGDTAKASTDIVQDALEKDINTDDRQRYDWQSKYPQEARCEIRAEAIYITIILIVSLAGLFLNWYGSFVMWLELENTKAMLFEQIAFFFFSGLLGGTIFGVKYFYRVVARGYWTQDRRYWRLFSPWISSCIALIVGCMVTTGYVKTNQTPSTAMVILVGFIAGYFADEAVGKMSEVATALFGNNSQTK